MPVSVLLTGCLSNVRLETCPLFKSKLLLVFDLYVVALFSCMGGTLFHSKIWQFHVTWRVAKHTGFVVYNSLLRWNHYYPLWISAKLFQWVWLTEVAGCLYVQLKCHKLNGNRWKLTSKYVVIRIISQYGWLIGWNEVVCESQCVLMNQHSNESSCLTCGVSWNDLSHPQPAKMCYQRWPKHLWSSCREAAPPPNPYTSKCVQHIYTTQNY